MRPLLEAGRPPFVSTAELTATYRRATFAGTCDADGLLSMVREVPSALADHTVLMARRGLHSEALRGLVYERRDLHAAVAYCSSYVATQCEWADRACTLLQVLLSPNSAPSRRRGVDGDGSDTGRGATRAADGGSRRSSSGAGQEVGTGGLGEAKAASESAWAAASREFALLFLVQQGAALPAQRVLSLLPSAMPIAQVSPAAYAVSVHVAPSCVALPPLTVCVRAAARVPRGDATITDAPTAGVTADAGAWPRAARPHHAQAQPVDRQEVRYDGRRAL